MISGKKKRTKIKKRKSNSIKNRIRLFLLITGIAVLFIVICLITCSWIINSKTKPFLFDKIESIKHSKVGLVLGTSKYLSAGRLNLFFKYRINATVALYKAGKIEYIIVSGDNHFIDYNEPEMMRKELIRSGIPGNKIFMDFAGFRTFDSIIRCHDIFGQTSFIVISQKFHNQRAVFISRHLGLDVIGFNAKDVELSDSFKTLVRECFARVKVFIDIYTDKRPKFLGEKIIIGYL